MLVFENEFRAAPKKAQHNFRVIYYFSRCIGLWPFTIVYNPNGSIKEARVQLWDRFWFLISISFYFAALSYYIERVITDRDHTRSANISNLIYYASQITFLLFGTVGILMDFFNRKNLATILDKFTTFDNEVSSFFSGIVQMSFIRDHFI